MNLIARTNRMSMYHPISISEKGIRGEFCPYCKAPTVRVAPSSISSYIPLNSKDTVFQCVCNRQHFVVWSSDDIDQQGTIADPYLRACRYLVASEINKMVALFPEYAFTKECIVRYVNYKLQNGTSDYLNVQLLAERDCFKILHVIRTAEWKGIIPSAFDEHFAGRIGLASKLFRDILSLNDFIEHHVFVEIFSALEIELPFDIFINRTFELIDFFRSCGDQFLRIVPAQCAVCYAQSDALGYLLIGNQSWNYTSFLFHFKKNKLVDIHDCGSMVHACQHLPLGSKYSFQQGRIINQASLYN